MAKIFMDIPLCATEAGLSIRHMRRLIQEDNIPVVQLGRKFFILTTEFNKWLPTHHRRDKREQTTATHPCTVSQEG